MINTSNPNLERPSVIFQGNTHFDIDTNRFSGKKSYDGQTGGVPLLYDNDKRSLAIDSSDTHTICFGASGSKKTRALVMPTIKVLGNAGESMIINDSKGELFDRMAGSLEKLGYNIITINLRDPSIGNAWNPLYIPYLYYKAGDMDKAAEFANDIANTLALGEVSDKDPYWDYSACDTCYGLILLTMRYCKECNLPDSAVNIGNLLLLRRKLFENGTRAKNSALWKWASEDELIAASLSGCIMTAEDTRNGILSVLDQKLRCFMIAPTLLDMLSNNNFAIEDIGNSKTAVFLITPDEKTTYHRLVSLFISQSYQHLIYSATQAGGKVRNRINYILDEFSSLPAIGSDFASYIAAARSRNIKFLIVVQSKNQLIRRYKEEAFTITANCTNWIVFFSRELDLLREISELCGQKKDHTPNVSVYDLQHLSKEKNEALLLSGRQKPCIVSLLDIDRFGEKRYSVIDIYTPERGERKRVDFSELPPGACVVEEKPFASYGSPFTTPFTTGSSENTSKEEKGIETDENMEIKAMIDAIDAKIAKLEADEAYEQEKLSGLIKKIEERKKAIISDASSEELIIIEGEV